MHVYDGVASNPGSCTWLLCVPDCVRFQHPGRCRAIKLLLFAVVYIVPWLCSWFVYLLNCEFYLFSVKLVLPKMLYCAGPYSTVKLEKVYVGHLRRVQLKVYEWVAGRHVDNTKPFLPRSTPLAIIFQHPTGTHEAFLVLNCSIFP